MKFYSAVIIESIHPNGQSVIVIFEGDKRKQHFEVHCKFNPYQHKLRKWDVWHFKIRWESEIFIDKKTNKKSYFTHLKCDEAIPIHQAGNGK